MKDNLLAVLQKLPDGKSTIPLEVIVDKLHNDIKINIKMSLTTAELSSTIVPVSRS